MLMQSQFRDTPFYLIQGRPSSLVDYLRSSTPTRSTSVTVPRHREVLEQIKNDPTTIGLDAHVEMFEERLFLNDQRKAIACPDLIAVNCKTYTVIEIGAQTPNRQLDVAYHFLNLNFGINPVLIAVRYSNDTFLHATKLSRKTIELTFQNKVITLPSPDIKNRKMPGMGMLEAKDYEE